MELRKSHYNQYIVVEIQMKMVQISDWDSPSQSYPSSVTPHRNWHSLNNRNELMISFNTLISEVWFMLITLMQWSTWQVRQHIWTRTPCKVLMMKPIWPWLTWLSASSEWLGITLKVGIQRQTIVSSARRIRASIDLRTRWHNRLQEQYTIDQNHRPLLEIGSSSVPRKVDPEQLKGIVDES